MAENKTISRHSEPKTLPSSMTSANLLMLVKKQLEFLQTSEKSSFHGSMLHHISESWCDVIEIDRNNQDIWSVAGTLLELAQRFQNHHRVVPLSVRFMSLLSDSTIQEKCRRSYSHCPPSLSLSSQMTLWSLHREAYEDMLLAVTKNSLSYENPFNTLKDKIKGVTGNPMLLMFAIDFYNCISLMSNTKQQDIRKLSNQMKKFLETTKTVE